MAWAPRYKRGRQSKARWVAGAQERSGADSGLVATAQSANVLGERDASSKRLLLAFQSSGEWQGQQTMPSSLDRVALGGVLVGAEGLL